MTTFNFIVLVCAGSLTIMALGFKLIGELMKKNDSGKLIKEPCEKRFDEIAKDFERIEGGAQLRHDRILTLEIRFAEIISRMSKLEDAMIQNNKTTNMIYQQVSKRKGNGIT
ncbi:MAG: hypothetical protein WC374_13255 [Phycisphaerae bacterium]